MSLGFQLANVDVGFLQDPKMVKLTRRVPDEGERAATILVYEQTMLESWRVGERVTATEAEILWEATPTRVAVLQSVGLLDDEARVTESAWEKYFLPALERSQRRREAGRKGGLANRRKRKHRSSGAAAPPRRRRSDGEAPPNLTPADPPSPKGEAGGGRVDQRVGSAPTRPPVRMDRLEDADIDALELMRRELPLADGRRRRLETEIVARRVAEPGRPSDLTAPAEAVFNGMGAKWLARSGRERGPDHA